MEIIRHSFYCYLYKEKYWKSIDISNNFCLLKNSIILGNNESENSLHYRGEHIIDAIKSRKLMKIILESVEDFLVMAVDVVNTKLPSAKFEEYFNVSQGKNVDSVTIIIAHSFIRRILCDETILPKAILFKYFISTLSNKQSIKEDYKWIFDVYAFNILFNLSAIKKQKILFLILYLKKGKIQIGTQSYLWLFKSFLKRISYLERKWYCNINLSMKNLMKNTFQED